MTAGLLAAGLALGTGTAWAADGDRCTYQGQVGVADGLYCVTAGTGEQLGLLADSVLDSGPTDGGGGEGGGGDGGTTAGGDAGGGSEGGGGDGAGTGGGTTDGGTDGGIDGGPVEDVVDGDTGAVPSETTPPPTTGSAPAAPGPAAPGPPPPAPGPLAAPAPGPAAPGLANLLSPGAFGATGGLSNGLLSPAPAIGTFAPQLLSAPAGSPLRTLAGADGGSPVTTASQVQALAFDDLPGGLGTPAVLGVLILSTLGALALRHRIIRRAKV